MRFFRRLEPFKAISFDLDDTLYSNRPIMLATDKKMTDYFVQHCSDFGINTEHLLNARFWFRFRNQALQKQPELAHDVGLLREKSYFLGALSLGLNTEKAAEFTESALTYFFEQRSSFSVPQYIHELLAHLKKQRPLVAITNGNVDTQRINIAQYFEHHFNASIEHKRKPHSDMFDKTIAALKITPRQLLHVGDCGKNDVFGGVDAGCQTVWLNKYSVGKPLKVLPTLALDNIEELQQLLP